MLSMTRCRRTGSLRWAWLIRRLATTPASSDRVSMMLPSRLAMLRLTRYSGAKAALMSSNGLFMVMLLQQMDCTG
ncbi:hypothetical protein D3C80_1897800 [compost metagenome]